MAATPMPTAAVLATPTSLYRRVPGRRHEAYRSWATEADEARVMPATTARIVAKATAATTANSTVPPVDLSPPPRASASSGTAVLPEELDARTSAAPTRAAAPKPSTIVIR